MESGDSDITVTESLQVAAARQTDEDVTVKEASILASLGQMIYNFLAHAIDIKRSNLIDKLVAKGILSPAEKQKLREQKRTYAKVNSLLMRLGNKSTVQFESFLTILSETGQQSVADVVLYTVHQTGHNPLRYANGMPA